MTIELQGPDDKGRQPVRVAWTPAYELVVSLAAVCHPKLHRDLDLEPGLARRARQILGADIHDEALRASDRIEQFEAGWLLTLVDACPGDGSADGFLAWLASAPVGELYEHLARAAPDNGEPLPRDLGAVRASWLRWLRPWNEGYFRHLDPALLDLLAARAEEARQAAEALGVDALIDRFATGLTFEKGTFDAVGARLVPQAHMAPFHLVEREHGEMVILYAIDLPTASADDPPRSLIRMLRALNDPSRLRILRILSGGPRNLGDLARETGLALSTVHHHLLALRVAGLLRNHADRSTLKRYSLRGEAIDRVTELLREHLGRPVGPITTAETARNLTEARDRVSQKRSTRRGGRR